MEEVTTLVDTELAGREVWLLKVPEPVAAVWDAAAAGAVLGVMRRGPAADSTAAPHTMSTAARFRQRESEVTATKRTRVRGLWLGVGWQFAWIHGSIAQVDALCGAAPQVGQWRAEPHQMGSLMYLFCNIPTTPNHSANCHFRVDLLCRCFFQQFLPHNHSAS